MSRTVLPILLFVISAFWALAGIMLLALSGWALRFSPATVPMAGNGFIVALLKGIGIMLLALAYLLCAAARDPVRYTSVIDTVIFVCAAAGILDLYAFGALHLRQFYPGPYLIARGIVALALAMVLIALRPRRAATAASSS